MNVKMYTKKNLEMIARKHVTVRKLVHCPFQIVEEFGSRAGAEKHHKFIGD